MLAQQKRLSRVRSKVGEVGVGAVPSNKLRRRRTRIMPPEGLCCATEAIVSVPKGLIVNKCNKRPLDLTTSVMV